MLSETTEVSLGSVSDWERLIRYRRIEMVFEAEVPPCTTRMRFVIPDILRVAVVALNIST
jgi:hypothetical protein